MVRRNVIGLIVLAGLLPLVLGGAVLATAGSQTVETTAAVEVRVWQSVHTDALYLSTRPAEGPWTTHNTPLDMSALHSGGNFFLSSIIPVTVPVTVTVAAPDAVDPVPDLATELDPAMETVSAWVYLWRSSYRLTGSIRMFTDFEAYDLDITSRSGGARDPSAIAPGFGVASPLSSAARASGTPPTRRSTASGSSTALPSRHLRSHGRASGTSPVTPRRASGPASRTDRRAPHLHRFERAHHDREAVRNALALDVASGWAVTRVGSEMAPGVAIPSYRDQREGRTADECRR